MKYCVSILWRESTSTSWRHSSENTLRRCCLTAQHDHSGPTGEHPRGFDDGGAAAPHGGRVGESVCSTCTTLRGKAVIGVDLGGSRSWSAACAVWPSGRIESWAIAPGVPSLAEQEREDQAAPSSYVELMRSGGLSVDVGRAVPGVETLLSRIWVWAPASVICDAYRSAELHQVIAGRVRIIERARASAESTSNVQALRALLLDTEAGVTKASRALLGAAFVETELTIGSDGSTKVRKRDRNRSRDDAAAALLLAAGELARRPAPVELRGALIKRDGSVVWL